MRRRGLVHAPGPYLRPAAAQEALGSHPSIFMAVRYSIMLSTMTEYYLDDDWNLVTAPATAEDLSRWANAFQEKHFSGHEPAKFSA